MQFGLQGIKRDMAIDIIERARQGTAQGRQFLPGLDCRPLSMQDYDNWSARRNSELSQILTADDGDGIGKICSDLWCEMQAFVVGFSVLRGPELGRFRIEVSYIERELIARLRREQQFLADLRFVKDEAEWERVCRVVPTLCSATMETVETERDAWKDPRTALALTANAGRFKSDYEFRGLRQRKAVVAYSEMQSLSALSPDLRTSILKAVANNLSSMELSPEQAMEIKEATPDAYFETGRHKKRQKVDLTRLRRERAAAR